MRVTTYNISRIHNSSNERITHDSRTTLVTDFQLIVKNNYHEPKRPNVKPSEIKRLISNNKKKIHY